ncbi:DNA-processing protein DprA [Agromyces italicus]|uniref:DNA-processing protein DprA n=1 Tax=Agromyces italicus TaxID=279572 RepID=UPI000684EC9A|nr:DNA-processing protein DprA [Agromyces italicus]
MLLAVACEPSDVITGILIARLGATETLQLMGSDGALPSGIDSVEGTLWRHRNGTRSGDGLLERVQADMQRCDLRLLTPEDAAWPAELHQLGARAPIALWLLGDYSALAGPLHARVAVVGARAATTYGTDTTSELVTALAQHDRIVLSGGAYGIDAAAHRAATAARPGATVAVLANGLDRMYPSGNEELFDRITTSGGLIISELPPGSVPTRWRFLQRNRILGALSGATVVVEAGPRSGALNVAGQAHSLGRPVGAVPGLASNPASAGCHRLIQEGIASLVANADDVTELLDARAPLPREHAFGPAPARSPVRTGHELGL